MGSDSNNHLRREKFNTKYVIVIPEPNFWIQNVVFNVTNAHLQDPVKFTLTQANKNGHLFIIKSTRKNAGNS